MKFTETIIAAAAAVFASGNCTNLQQRMIRWEHEPACMVYDEPNQQGAGRLWMINEPGEVNMIQNLAGIKSWKCTTWVWFHWAFCLTGEGCSTMTYYTEDPSDGFQQGNVGQRDGQDYDNVVLTLFDTTPQNLEYMKEDGYLDY